MNISGIRHFGALTLLLSVLCAPSPAFCQANAAASALFKQGMDNRSAGDYRQAVVNFRESYKLEPQLGTLYTLAVSEVDAEVYASAYAHFEEFLGKYATMPPTQQQQQLKRAQSAQAEMARIGPLRAWLKVTLPPPPLPDMKIFLDDGVELSGPTLGLELPVDPGQHTLMVQVPDRPISKQIVQLDKGQHLSVELVVPPAPPIVETPTQPKGSTDVVVPPSRIDPPSAMPRAQPAGIRTAAYVIGGIGVAGLGVGAVMGGLVASKANVIKLGCPNAVCVNQASFDAHGSAKMYGLLSEIGFGLGIAGFGLGTVLYFASSPSAKRTGLVLDVGPIGKDGMMGRLEGRF